MKIGLFSDTYKSQINGVVTALDILENNLRRLGHEVYIFAPAIPGYQDEDPERVWRFASLPFILMPEHRVTWPYSRRLRKFSELKLDLIHSHTPFFMGGLAIYLAKKYRLPHLHTYHTFFAKYGHYIMMPQFINQKIAALATQWVCAQTQGVITPSLAMKRILESYGVSQPLYVIPSGIDIENFRTGHGAKIFHRYDLPPAAKILTYIGRLAREKNLDFLLEVFAAVAAQRPDSYLFFIGDGPERKDLAGRARQLGLAGRVVFTGYQPRTELPDFLAASQLFLFASKTETQGLVVLEALAAGVPVVAVAAMGVEDVLAPGRGGWLLPEDSAVFSQKILEILSDQRLRQAKAAETSQVAIDFASPRMTERLAGLYEKVLAEHQTAAG